MENLWSREHTVELFEMYEKELRLLSGENEDLHQQNAEIRRLYRKKLRGERKRNAALRQEVDKLKELLSGKAAGQVSQQLQEEKNLRMKAEAKDEDEEDEELEETHRVPPKRTVQIPEAKLIGGVDDLGEERLELNLKLQKEKELRAQEEAQKPEVLAVADDMQRTLQVPGSHSRDFVDKISAAEKTVYAMSNSCTGLEKERDELQQELVELLQREASMRDQIEHHGLREFEMLELLCQELSGLETSESRHLCQDAAQI